jgi:acetylornithine deacetylase/succinyl-diaminopimelate desuccinylase-like protein
VRRKYSVFLLLLGDILFTLTYAKEAKNTIAFGSCFPGKVDHIHEIDEKIDLEDFFNSIPIYAHAIYALGNLK